MFRILLTALAAVLFADAEGAAQRVAVSVARSESFASDGWGRGELFRGNSIRVELPRAGLTPFVTLGRVQDRRRNCADDCVVDELALSLAAGIDHRFRRDAAWQLVPYLGAGAELQHWPDRTVVRPHLHGGVDLFATRAVAVRLEAQSNWSVPGMLALGLRVGL